MDDELAPMRGEIRSAAARRVSHGLFLPVASGLDDATEWRRELGAWLLVLPPDAVFTHITAAALYGWWLPQLPELVPVFAATRLDDNRPRRAGVSCARLEQPADGRVRCGLPVDSPEEVLLRAARDLGLLDLVVLVDAALHFGDITLASLAEICACSRPGVRRLRKAADLADRSESAWETLLRIFHRMVGIEVEPQALLHDDEGTFVARVDLLVRGTRYVHEYDGAQHEKSRQRTIDRQRERRLADAGYTRRGYTAPDLVTHPQVTLHELDRWLGRPHRAGRITRWRTWVAESCYSVSGRRRLQNRWLMTGHWAQTA